MSASIEGSPELRPERSTRKQQDSTLKKELELLMLDLEAERERSRSLTEALEKERIQHLSTRMERDQVQIVLDETDSRFAQLSRKLKDAEAQVFFLENQQGKFQQHTKLVQGALTDTKESEQGLRLGFERERQKSRRLETQLERIEEAWEEEKTSRNAACSEATSRELATRKIALQAQSKVKQLSLDLEQAKREINRLKSTYPLQDLLKNKDHEIQQLQLKLTALPENHSKRSEIEALLLTLTEQRKQIHSMLRDY